MTSRTHSMNVCIPFFTSFFFQAPIRPHHDLHSARVHLEQNGYVASPGGAYPFWTRRGDFRVYPR
jgi:hypothetical protein